MACNVVTWFLKLVSFSLFTINHYKMHLKILATDISFLTPSEAGEPGCFCSRCLGPIAAEDEFVRVFNISNFGSHRKQVEYRFCANCSKGLLQTDSYAH